MSQAIVLHPQHWASATQQLADTARAKLSHNSGVMSGVQTHSPHQDASGKRSRPAANLNNVERMLCCCAQRIASCFKHVACQSAAIPWRKHLDGREPVHLCPMCRGVLCAQHSSRVPSRLREQCWHAWYHSTANHRWKVEVSKGDVTRYRRLPSTSTVTARTLSSLYRRAITSLYSARLTMRSNLIGAGSRDRGGLGWLKYPSVCGRCAAAGIP
jgi:hypothetical protein